MLIEFGTRIWLVITAKDSALMLAAVILPVGLLRKCVSCRGVTLASDKLSRRVAMELAPRELS